MRPSGVKLRALLGLALLAALLAPAPTDAPRVGMAAPIVVVGANQSNNWSGYVQGRLEKNTTFHSISASWKVPRVKQRVAGEAEYSSTWIGIGGGCVDAECKIPDVTLIQAGIGHDVDAAGNADYYAWGETIPGPLVRAPSLTVRAGDLVNVSIAEQSSGLLLDMNGRVIARPSSPDRDADGFNDCAHRAACRPPRHELP